MKEILQQVYWGNTVQAYLIALAGIIAAWAVLRLIKGILLRFLRRITKNTKTDFDDILVTIAEKFVIPFIYLLINYNIITQLNLSVKVDRILSVAIAMIAIYYGVKLVNYFIHGAVLLYMNRKGENPERVKQVNGILLVFKALVWCLGIVLLIDNLGYNVTTIIAGLGVGGIAIALAAQNILSDLFSYLVIFFDKPFEIGDFIVVGPNSGVVEKIGIKTSHVRSLDGQQLVMPNAELVKTVIHNFKRLERRRIVLSIGVVYGLPPEQLQNIPAVIKEIIEANENATFDRAHFKSFGDFSINFEVVYYVDSADFLLYMNTNQAVCMEIYRRFAKEKIDFAFPTQTIVLDSKGKEVADKRSTLENGTGPLKKQSEQY